MKDDIKTEPNNQPPQFRQPLSSPPRNLDGKVPPDSVNLNTVQSQSGKPDQTTLNQQDNQELKPQTDEQKPDQQNKPPSPAKPKKKRGILPIAISIIILLALSSLAVYAGLIKKDESQRNLDNTDASAHQPAISDAEDRQALQQVIDQIDELPDDKDTSGDNLTDQKLGL
ncbi:hypothetical protein KY385_00185 [Candidatus Parcubacteria bacterium]|nr:hypothetical protein [Candidatus Parcubacteria bacterium]